MSGSFRLRLPRPCGCVYMTGVARITRGVRERVVSIPRKGGIVSRPGPRGYVYITSGTKITRDERERAGDIHYQIQEES
jgi:hypothetical protein